MRRILEPEILDTLDAEDPLAESSRRDLRRVNALMGNEGLCHRAIVAALEGRAPKRLVELGCGDGEFLAGIAREFQGRPGWRDVEVWLVDRVPAVREPTLGIFREAGWSPRVVTADVFAWLDEAPGADLYLANLFLHHFSGDSLRTLLRGVARRASVLVACEPRRSRLALWASRGLGLIGCNAVTRHDGVVSVRAGFAGKELGGLWPDEEGWVLTESGAGWFSHLFTARRKGRGA
jgi:SAM-dependent methyltransferase